MYEVFSRDWWRIENGKRVPHSGAPETHIEYVDTIKEAREACKEFNDNNDEGILSHKAEFKDA